MKGNALVEKVTLANFINYLGIAVKNATIFIIMKEKGELKSGVSTGLVDIVLFVDTKSVIGHWSFII